MLRILKKYENYLDTNKPILTYILPKKEDAIFELGNMFKQINVICPLDKQCKLADNYNLDNVTLYCQSILDHIDNIKSQDIIMISINFTGVPKHEKQLHLEGSELSDIINIYHNRTKLFILKVPRQYDFDYFIKNMKYNYADIYSKCGEPTYYIVVKT